MKYVLPKSKFELFLDIASSDLRLIMLTQLPNYSEIPLTLTDLKKDIDCIAGEDNGIGNDVIHPHLRYLHALQIIEKIEGIKVSDANNRNITVPGWKLTEVGEEYAIISKSLVNLLGHTEEPLTLARAFGQTHSKGAPPHHTGTEILLTLLEGAQSYGKLESKIMNEFKIADNTFRKIISRLSDLGVVAYETPNKESVGYGWNADAFKDADFKKIAGPYSEIFKSFYDMQIELKNGFTIHDFAKKYDMTYSAASKRLGILTSAGIVKKERKKHFNEISLTKSGELFAAALKQVYSAVSNPIKYVTLDSQAATNVLCGYVDTRQ